MIVADPCIVKYDVPDDQHDLVGCIPDLLPLQVLVLERTNLTDRGTSRHLIIEFIKGRRKKLNFNADMSNPRA